MSYPDGHFLFLCSEGAAPFGIVVSQIGSLSVVFADKMPESTSFA